jgi:hypothetical protein
MAKRMALALAASLALAAVVPAIAQQAAPPPVIERGNSLVLQALGHDYAVPLPDWLTPAERLSGNVLPLVDPVYNADPKQSLLEIYPKGETPENWTTLYAARITLDAGRPLTDYRSAVMFGYSQTCKPELTGFFKFGEDQGEVLAPLGFVCGAYMDNLASYKGQGEVMVVSFTKTAKGVAIVYQEWRGPAFDPSDPKTWPVDAERLKQRAEQFRTEPALTLAD